MTQPKNDRETRVSLVDHLRQAMRESGLSVYRIAKDADVDQPTLHKFLHGTRDNLTLAVADRLFRVLGLEVTGAKRRGTPKNRSTTGDE
ncbi:MAG: helix-turn-helix transcriptional regulator [Isosphaeraceae bacterium]